MHYTTIVGEGFCALKDGETVDYELVKGEKGWQARNVHRIADTPTAVAKPDEPQP